MKIEIDINDDAFDAIFTKILKQHLDSTLHYIEQTKEGKACGVYSWVDTKRELSGLRKDEKALRHLLKMYGVEE